MQFRLRDWLISRQRYWGNPIPAIHCPECGLVPVPEEDLPVRLPEDIDLSAGETLATHEAFVNTTCPVCGGPAKRETDTMDTFTCSSWYYLRYTDPHNDELPFAPEKANRWLPVDQYIGGIEHAILHLLYSRFYTKVLRDLGMVDFDEPFANLLCQGMVKDEHGETMSKSKGNVIAPEDMIAEYGADAVRAYILFMAPPDKDLLWDEGGLAGIYKFMNRAWRIVNDLDGRGGRGKRCTSPARTEAEGAEALEDARARAASRGGQGGRRLRPQQLQHGHRRHHGAARTRRATTCASARPRSARRARASQAVDAEVAEVHREAAGAHSRRTGPRSCGTRCWATKARVHTQPWPEFDPEQAKADEVELAVQVNGKVKAKIMVAADAAEDDIKAAGLGRRARPRSRARTSRRLSWCPGVW